MTAALDDAAGFDDEDLIGGDDRRQSVGDDQRRTAGEGSVQRRLDVGLRRRVEARGRLVEDDHGRLGEQQPGDRQPLTLTTRQPVAALSDDGVETGRQGAHERIEVGVAQRRPQLLLGCIGRGEQQVLADAVVEQVAVLGDHADGPAQRLERQLTDVDAADRHRPRVDVVQPREQGGDRRLAGARRADEGDDLARLDAERDVVKDLLAAAGVERGDLLERRQRDLVGGRVGEADVVEGNADWRRAGPCVASGASSINGSRSRTSKTRSKLTRAVIASTRALASAVSGA